ncbi:hypothetical protein PENTCL1PPCAC_13969, partial [Pristionchus entomophagus]
DWLSVLPPGFTPSWTPGLDSWTGSDSMIVSNSLHHRGIGGGLDERRTASRCSLELIGDVVSSSSSSSISSKMTSSSIPPLSALAVLSPSTSTSTEEEMEEDGLSSPASSGYGRSTTSESEDLRSAALRLNALRTGGRRAGGADGEGGGEWSVMSMPRHPFLTAIGRFLPVDDIEDLGSLGEGFFSVVDKVRIRSTGEILVRKVAKPGVRGERRETHADVAREAKMLRRLEHDNVLALRGMSIVQSEIGEWDLHLFLDYCEGGSLSRLLLDPTMALPWRHRFSFAVDIARGMEHIHSRRVIHRDLTSMNVLIQYAPSFPSCGRAVIADFGLSCEFPKEGEKLSQVGTTYFMSPECLKEQHYDEKSDVFSFGIILCQLIARIDADPDTGLHRTADFGLNYRLFISYCPTDTRMELLQVAFGCVLMDPSFRLSFTEILSQLERVLTAMNKQAAAIVVSPSDISPGRLERSRSDAALRRPRAVHQRKYSAYHRPTVKPVTEGLAEEAAAMDASYLDRLPPPSTPAADAATAESLSPTGRPMQLQGSPLSSMHCRRTLPSPLNPFSAHARFRSARKILPSREEERDRRQSERQREGEEEEGAECDGGRRRRPGRLIRRCSSLPSEMDSPHSIDWSDDEGGWRESDEEGEMGDDEVYYDKSSMPGCATSSTTTVDTLARVFTEWDQKFLRQSRRFSTRRNTIMGSAASAATGGAAAATSSPTASQTMTPTVLPLTVCPPPSDSVASPDTSASYSPATGDRLNNNGATPAAAAADEAEFGPTIPTKYSSWPKR